MAYKKKYKNLDNMQEVVLGLIPPQPSQVHSKDIASYLNEQPRDVRYIIQTLRDNGFPICATPKDGYWIARTSFDLNETIRKMRSHIENCEYTLDALVQAKKDMERKENGN